MSTCERVEGARVVDHGICPCKYWSPPSPSPWERQSAISIIMLSHHRCCCCLLLVSIHPACKAMAMAMARVARQLSSSSICFVHTFPRPRTMSMHLHRMGSTNIHTHTHTHAQTMPNWPAAQVRQTYHHWPYDARNTHLPGHGWLCVCVCVCVCACMCVCVCVCVFVFIVCRIVMLTVLSGCIHTCTVQCTCMVYSCTSHVSQPDEYTVTL